jgi:excinuclease ABC subunit A
VIRNADWIIDIGPEGGKQGGQVMFEGTLENMRKLKSNYTLQYL